LLPPSGERLSPEKPEADFANLIALGFSALITTENYVKSKSKIFILKVAFSCQIIKTTLQDDIPRSSEKLPHWCGSSAGGLQ
jgi:hypothetical protein